MKKDAIILLAADKQWPVGNSVAKQLKCPDHSLAGFILHSPNFKSLATLVKRPTG